MGSQNKEDSIIVKDIHKFFRIYDDKSNTLKAKILSSSRNRYKKHQVLDGVSFSLKKGEAVGLIGHNGCGKSTTLKLLNKILYPDSGTITIKGKISSLIELGAGFHPDMTGRENIYINATIFGLKKAEIDERLDDIIRFSELEEFIDNPVRTYSSGMYMRLAFSVAINVDADVLLIDEILAVGDTNFQNKCFRELKKIKNMGTTIVIVSHSMDQIKSICDRVIWLEKGKIVGDGYPGKVCQQYLLAMQEKEEKRAEKEKQEKKAKEKNEEEDIISKYPPQNVCDHCSRFARRYGNLNAYYDHAELLDSKKNISYDFTLGEDFYIKFRIRHRAMEKISSISFKIFNQYGGHCCTFDNRWDNAGIADKDVIEGQLLLKDIRLLSGEYYIEAVIYGEDGEAVDNMTHFIEFSVGPKYNNFRDNLGVINIEHEWEF